MRILHVTNTFTPDVSGVSASVEAAVSGLRRRGHEVRVVAPFFEGAVDTPGVLRVPAIPKVLGSRYSIALPLLSRATTLFALTFRPHVIHSHAPFGLGDDAAEAARWLRVPLVYTYHTIYEHQTVHFSSLDATQKDAVGLFAAVKAAKYAKRASVVIVPSPGIGRLLRGRGAARVVSLPTGIPVARFAVDRAAARAALRLPRGTFVIGHVGRLAGEKNIPFLGRCVASFLRGRPDTYFILAGDGPLRVPLLRGLERAGVQARVRYLGVVKGLALARVYAAMDVFAFTSRVDAGPLVCAEALTAGTPVVALPSPGAEDVIRGQNGYLVRVEDVSSFCAALEAIRVNPPHYTAVRESVKWLDEELWISHLERLYRVVAK